MTAEQDHDALIVGAGPAGMAAAVELVALGLRPLVVDEQPLPGGQIWRASEAARPERTRQALGADYAAGTERVAQFRQSGADYLPGTRMWHLEPGFQAFMSQGGAAFRAASRRCCWPPGRRNARSPDRAGRCPAC